MYVSVFLDKLLQSYYQMAGNLNLVCVLILLEVCVPFVHPGLIDAHSLVKDEHGKYRNRRAGKPIDLKNMFNLSKYLGCYKTPDATKLGKLKV